MYNIMKMQQGNFKSFICDFDVLILLIVMSDL